MNNNSRKINGDEAIAKLKQNPTTTETVSWDGFSSGNTAGSGDASTGKAGTQTGSN